MTLLYPLVDSISVHFHFTVGGMTDGVPVREILPLVRAGYGDFWGASSPVGGMDRVVCSAEPMRSLHRLHDGRTTEHRGWKHYIISVALDCG